MGVLVPEGPTESKLFEATGDGDVDLSPLMRQIFDAACAHGSGLLTGVSSVTQLRYLMHLARSFEAKAICEIGFNIGFSSLAFLESDPEARVVSFELNGDQAVTAAKEFIDARYPGRHEIIFGDSMVSVPEFADGRSGADGFDLIFIDGGHEYDEITADLKNCRRLARHDAIVVVDDITPWYPWGVGPTLAWTEAVRDGHIVPLEYLCDGVPKDSPEGPADRVWAVGRLSKPDK